MKYLAHVPVEQYGFISVEVEGTASDIWDAYQGIASQIKFGNGMPEKEFTKLFDAVAQGNSVSGDPGMPELNAFQRFAIGEARKFANRKAGIKTAINNHN